MVKISPLARVLLLITGLLAAYQIAFGIEGASLYAMIAYTVAFGILLVAGLLLIILGFDVLESETVVSLATFIPLSLSFGLIVEHLPVFQLGYLVFVIAGFLGVLLTRYLTKSKMATLVLAVVHGISGLIIFALPIIFSLNGSSPAGFIMVGIGGGLIGAGGLLLAFLKIGSPILKKEQILNLLPGLLLLMTISFVVGFAAI